MSRQVPDGWTVKVFHHRVCEDEIARLMSLTPAARKVYLETIAAPTHYLKKAESSPLSPRAGHTQVVILDQAEQEVACGHAFCSPFDNYNKKIGRNIALGRALKEAGVGA